MLGEDIVNSVKSFTIIAQKRKSSKVGHSQYGCDVYLNKAYVESDFKIVTGFIEPHFSPDFQVDLKG